MSIFMKKARVEFPSRIRQARWDHAVGCCEDCGIKLRPGNIEFDHELALAAGGESTFDNCRVRCGNCHGVKTSTCDVPMIKKLKRVARKHVGASARSSNPLPGGRCSGMKKKVSGEVVPR